MKYLYEDITRIDLFIIHGGLSPAIIVFFLSFALLLFPILHSLSLPLC